MVYLSEILVTEGTCNCLLILHSMSFMEDRAV